MAKKIAKPANETKLERTVRYWLNQHGRDYENGWMGAYRDLEYGGCQAGTVGMLIYYRDTVKFYKRYRAEINAMLKEFMSDMGCEGPKGLFGEKWDDDDPLADGDLNRNLLAWFGFEETARRIAQANGYDN